LLEAVLRSGLKNLFRRRCARTAHRRRPVFTGFRAIRPQNPVKTKTRENPAPGRPKRVFSLCTKWSLWIWRLNTRVRQAAVRHCSVHGMCITSIAAICRFIHNM